MRWGIAVRGVEFTRGRDLGFARSIRPHVRGTHARLILSSPIHSTQTLRPAPGWEWRRAPPGFRRASGRSEDARALTSGGAEAGSPWRASARGKRRRGRGPGELRVAVSGGDDARASREDAGSPGAWLTAAAARAEPSPGRRLRPTMVRPVFSFFFFKLF